MLRYHPVCTDTMDTLDTQETVIQRVPAEANLERKTFLDGPYNKFFAMEEYPELLYILCYDEEVRVDCYIEFSR